MKFFRVDFKNNKKLTNYFNAIAIIIAVVMAVPMHFHVSIAELFDVTDNMGLYLMRFVVLMVSVFVYLVLHELTHGIVMKFVGTKKVKYGFTGLYAFAGSDDYYDKKSYLMVALAPVLLWGIVIAIINAMVSVEWFWVVYLVQIMNVSGGVGDLYVTYKFLKMPKDILVQDSGEVMVVYSAETL